MKNLTIIILMLSTISLSIAVYNINEELVETEIYLAEVFTEVNSRTDFRDSVIVDAVEIIDSLRLEVKRLKPDTNYLPDTNWEYLWKISFETNTTLLSINKELKRRIEFNDRCYRKLRIDYADLMKECHRSQGCQEIYEICSRKTEFWKGKYEECKSSNK